LAPISKPTCAVRDNTVQETLNAALLLNFIGCFCSEKAPHPGPHLKGKGEEIGCIELGFVLVEKI
jgi:hypothetical protein